MSVSARLGHVSQSAFSDRARWAGWSGIMVAVATVVGDRYRVLTDKQWELLELLLPKSDGQVGRNFANNRLVVEGMLFRLRTGGSGGTCRRRSVCGRRCGSGIAAMSVTGPGIECWSR
ncbi:transposase [Nocardia brasiliensis]|uniref:Transposase n=1 Tax=Nocardia brasiliensis TaxID=37326 RepID=A0A6G9XMW2_NOCBR|nr:transposase [Nocardia brasiliensis]